MQHKPSKQFRLLTCTFAVLAALQPNAAYAEESDFNANFFGSDDATISHLSRFNSSDYVPAGNYDVDVFVNGELKGRTKVDYIENGNGTHLCLTPELIQLFDLKPEAIVTSSDSTTQNCGKVSEVLPQAKIRLDQGTLALKLEIPQALTVIRPRGYIPTSLWQSGVPTAYVNYSLSHYAQSLDGYSSNSQYLYLNSGINIGGWGLRHSGSYSRNSGQTSSYNSGYTYLQGGIPSLQSQVTIGDFTTEGSIVDSVNLRGAMIASDDRMLPQTQRGYAPRVQGIARSNAVVTIRQNGNVIYQTNVPAGPFDIIDLYPTGYSGELFVEVREADGSSSTFSVPYGTLVPLVRSGQVKYQVAAGRYRYGNDIANDNTVTGSIQYGMSNNVTLNGGFILNPHYRSGTVGLSVNTPIGAFSGDITRALANLGHDMPEERGVSVRANYNLYLTESKTNITLAAYRFAAKGYYSFDETMSSRAQVPNEHGIIYDIRTLSLRPKNRYQVTVSQELSDKLGSFYLSSGASNYWNKSGTDIDFQVSYANRYKQLSYQISAAQAIVTGEEKRTRRHFALNLSMPLSIFNREEGRSNGYYTLAAYARNTGPNGIRQSYLDSVGEHNKLNYSLSTETTSDSYTSGSGTLSYRSNIGSMSASLNVDNRSGRSFNFNASGAVVAHPKGITLSDSVGTTFGIVHAKNGRGARLNNGLGKKLDYFGNAIIEHLTPYEYNRIGIDPSDLPINIEFDATEREVVPKANTGILVELNAQRNSMVLFNISVPNGRELPLGAAATNSKGEIVGYIAQGGTLFANRLSETKDTLSIRYGSNADDVCRVQYNIPDLETHTGIPAQYELTCEDSTNK